MSDIITETNSQEDINQPGKIMDSTGKTGISPDDYCQDNDKENISLKDLEQDKSNQESCFQESSDKESNDQESIDKEISNQTSRDQESIDKESIDKESIDKENYIKDNISDRNLVSQNLTGNENRRKRVNRMKTAIVVIVILLLLFPTICCIVLGIQVNRLQRQINDWDQSRYGSIHELSSDTDRANTEGKSVSETNPNAEEAINQVLSAYDNRGSNMASMDEIITADHKQPDQAITPDENNADRAFNTSQPGNSSLSTYMPDSDLITSQTNDTNSGEDNYIIDNFNNDFSMPVYNSQLSSQSQIAADSYEADNNGKSNNGSSNLGNSTNGNSINENSNNENSGLNENSTNENISNENNNIDVGLVNNNDTATAKDSTDNVNENSASGDNSTVDDKNKNSDAQATGENKTGSYAGKTVYLTFDDGPSIYTGEILDTLAKYNVKATFFVVGKTDDQSIEMYQRIVKEGHTLGMHSYSHEYDYVYNSVEDFDKDFTKLWKLLYDTTGYKPSIYRFPGGSNNQVNKYGMEDFIRYLNTAGIVYFDWNVVSGDATGIKYSKEQLVGNVLSGVAVKKISIVLMHDSRSKKTTVESLPALLEKLTSEGAVILPLDKNVTPIQMIKADTIK